MLKTTTFLELFNDETLKGIGESILKFNPTSADQISELMSQIDDRQTQALIASLAMGDESWNRKGCLRLLGKFVEKRAEASRRWFAGGADQSC